MKGSNSAPEDSHIERMTGSEITERVHEGGECNRMTHSVKWEDRVLDYVRKRRRGVIVRITACKEGISKHK